MAENTYKKIDLESGQTDEIRVPHTIKLSVPVPFGKDETIEELTFPRRMVGGDLMGISTQNILFDDMFKLISRMTGQPMIVIKKMDASDLFDAIKVVNSFLPAGPATE